MIGAAIKKNIKTITTSLVASVVLSGSLWAVQPTTIANGVEMGLALATIPSDILAHRYDCTESKKTAAKWHLVTDAISLLNKGFFFYNNYQAQYRVASPGDKRDCYVNGVWFARDMVRCVKHLRAYKTAHDLVALPKNENPPVQVQAPIIANPDIFLALDQEDDEPELELAPEEMSRLAYLCYTVIIPSLRGLTAFGLACSQDEAADDFDSERGRFLATAAHNLARVAQEYSELDSGASKKLLALGLIGSTVWLWNEVQAFNGYKQRQIARRELIARQAARDLQRQQELARQAEQRIDELFAVPVVPLPLAPGAQQLNACQTCLNDVEPGNPDTALIPLPCGHAVSCRECMLGHMNQGIADDGVGAAQLRCPNQGCLHNITDADVRRVVGNDRDILRRFILAGIPHQVGQGPVVGGLRAQAGRAENMCGRCLLPHGADLSCEQALPLATDEDRETAADLRRNNLRYCPRKECGVLVEKIGGCNSVLCRCHHYFCWTCGQPDPNHDMRQRNGVWVSANCGCETFDQGMRMW